MKLIREEIEEWCLLPKVKTARRTREGVFLQGNIKNRNGRMYPMELFAEKLEI